MPKTDVCRKAPFKHEPQGKKESKDPEMTP